MLRSAAEHPLSSRRILTGLLGAPIAHSASPAMHERTAEALGLRCHYQLIEVADASREELKFLLEGVRRLGFAGINVTFPYKEAVLDLLDELSPSAAMIGAVNTVVVRDGRLIGYNTDTTGFARAVSGLVTASAHGAVAVIGAGGVGKAIAFALAGLGVNELRIFDSEHAGLWVADAVYSPLWTPLLMAAKAKGAAVMTGRELAIYQAADAFELFTGLTPSSTEIGIAFDEVMAKGYSASHAA